ncbi:MAG TPA: hypothetical protein VGF37_10635 [Chthoniobacterales bacterium]|jgi:hypothetical protein
MKAQDILCLYTATIGIDWADSKHDVFERYLDGSICQHQIASTPEAVGEWLWALRCRAKGGRVWEKYRERWGADDGREGFRMRILP